MADTIKVLAQSALSATTLTDVYTVPGATTTVVSSVTICNRGTATTFRLSVAIAGGADANAQYLYYDLAIPANDTFALTLGVSLGAADVLRAYAGSANVSVNVFGVELT